MAEFAATFIPVHHVSDTAEILFGLRLLPDGLRREGLWSAALAIFDMDFCEQTLSFDTSAADAFAEISASR